MTVVRDAPERSRFEIEVDGAIAGFAEYRLLRDRITFVHTEIDGAFSGQGLASRLIKFALDDARGRGLAVLPVCPFVKAYIQKHPEYTDLVPEPARAKFEV